MRCWPQRVYDMYADTTGMESSMDEVSMPSHESLLPGTVKPPSTLFI